MSVDQSQLQASHSDQIAGLRKLTTVFQQVADHDLSYCHWKSNYHLKYAVTAVEDLDLLVDAFHFSQFAQILLNNDFKLAESITSRDQPGVFHFLCNDEETGALINIHAYTQILTGDHILKSWNLPFEKMLLSDTTLLHGVNVPAKSSELIVFVLRNMIKHTTFFDLYFTTRATRATMEEYKWLTSEDEISDALEKLPLYFPEIDPTDFKVALNLLETRNLLTTKIMLGLRFTKALGKYRRYGVFKQTRLSLFAAFRMAANRFMRRQKYMSLLTGGKIIALVGPQATGKSTVAEAVEMWLGVELAVNRIHAGKPPGTWLTAIPNLLIPLARKLLPGFATVKIEKQAEDHDSLDFPLVFLLRKVILAYERRALLRSAFRQSRNGTIVVSDRYPSDVVGAVDGATFRDDAIEMQPSALKRYLMKLERKLYRDVCPPDLVLQLTVPLEHALKRNLERDKEGDQSSEYVQLRHTMRYQPEFHRCPVIPLSTDRDLDEMLRDVKQELWRRL